MINTPYQLINMNLLQHVLGKMPVVSGRETTCSKNTVSQTLVQRYHNDVINNYSQI